MRRRDFLSLLGSAVPLLFSSSLVKANSPQNADLRLRLVAAARSQIGVTEFYNGGYQKIPYPNGDVDRNTGVCTDVVIRAYRDAFGYDLQKHVHEDMAKNFDQYPKIWGLKTTDRNIDHRRVPNLQCFFLRKKARIHAQIDQQNLKPGDIVTQMIDGRLPHIVIVSDSFNSQGIPLVIHNIGRGTQEEDSLLQFPATGHYYFIG